MRHEQEMRLYKLKASPPPKEYWYLMTILLCCQLMSNRRNLYIHTQPNFFLSETLQKDENFLLLQNNNQCSTNIDLEISRWFSRHVPRRISGSSSSVLPYKSKLVFYNHVYRTASSKLFRQEMNDICFTCIRNAISMTKLFRYPSTRLTTPLATVEEPTSIWSWNLDTICRRSVSSISITPKVFVMEWYHMNIILLVIYLQVVLPANIIYFKCLSHQACWLPNALLDYPWSLRKAKYELDIWIHINVIPSLLVVSWINNTNLRDVWYELKSWISKGVISVNKFVQQGVLFQRSFHHVIQCQRICGCTRHLNINNEEKFWSTSLCICLNEQYPSIHQISVFFRGHRDNNWQWLMAHKDILML